MAANLARDGFKVTGWNRTQGKAGSQVASAAGVKLATNPHDAVANAQAVFLCLGDETDITDILVGGESPLAGAIPTNSVIVDMSTSGPQCARALDSELKSRGLRFLDAPVSGGDIGAKQGTLTIMVGGDPEDFAQCLPLFNAMGKAVKHCGPAGSGQVVKLCNQILCAVNMVGVCEALHLAENLKVDPQLVVEVCSTGAAGSWALANLGPRIANEDYEPGFMLKHMLKDLRLVAQELTGSLAEELPGTNLAQTNFEHAKAVPTTKGGDQGTQSMMRVYRETR